MITKYDVTMLDRNSLPEEVLHEINEHEGLGYELVSIKKYDTSDMTDGHINDIWDLTFFEPFFQFEASPFDTFHFARVCYSNWPQWSVNKYFHAFSRGDMAEAISYESKRQKEEIA